MATFSYIENSLEDALTFADTKVLCRHSSECCLLRRNNHPNVQHQRSSKEGDLPLSHVFRNQAAIRLSENNLYPNVISSKNDWHQPLKRIAPRFTAISLTFLSFSLARPYLSLFPCNLLPLLHDLSAFSLHYSTAASHVSQQMWSHRYSCWLVIIIQQHLPVVFHSLPHQQQFHRPFFFSNGHGDKGHLAARPCSVGGAWPTDVRSSLLHGFLCLRDDEDECLELDVAFEQYVIRVTTCSQGKV